MWRGGGAGGAAHTELSLSCCIPASQSPQDPKSEAEHQESASLSAQAFTPPCRPAEKSMAPCAGGAQPGIPLVRGPGRRPSAALEKRCRCPCARAQDAAAMQVQEVEDLRGHGVEAGPGLTLS